MSEPISFALTCKCAEVTYHCLVNVSNFTQRSMLSQYLTEIATFPMFMAVTMML